MRKMRKVCLDGKLVAEDQAQISVFDDLFLGGVGVYETLRTYGGKIWQPERHLRRLANSAHRLAIKMSFSSEEIAVFLGQTVTANGFTESRIRITLSGGCGLLYGGGDRPRLVIIVTELKSVEGLPVPLDLYVYRGERILPEIKSCNLLLSKSARRAVGKAGGDEALLVDHRGRITEAAFSNVFFVADGALFTPPEKLVLPGVTREVILELARREGMKVMEKTLYLSDISKMSECFLTNTVRGVVPVRAIWKKGEEYLFDKTRPVTEAVIKLLGKAVEANDNFNRF